MLSDVSWAFSSSSRHTPLYSIFTQQQSFSVLHTASGGCDLFCCFNHVCPISLHFLCILKLYFKINFNVFNQSQITFRNYRINSTPNFDRKTRVNVHISALLGFSLVYFEDFYTGTSRHLPQCTYVVRWWTVGHFTAWVGSWIGHRAA